MPIHFRIPSFTFDKFELTISLFLALVSLGVVRFYVCARTGFPVSYSDINNVSGVSLFVLLLPTMINILGKSFSNKDRSQYIGFNALITFSAILLIICSSFIVNWTGYWLLSVIAVMGYAFLLIAVYLFIRYTEATQWLFLFIFSLLMLIWLVGIVYSDEYHNPLFFENIIVGGGKMDTFFHASMVQMIKTHNIPSTGLHGVPYVTYHWGSHWLLAKFSILLNTSAITTYNLVYPALFLCLYFKTSLTLSYDIARQISAKFNKAPLRIGIKFWLFFLTAHIGFLPYSFVNSWAVWNSWILSESYLVALIFLFMSASIALFIYNNVLQASKQWLKVFTLLIPLSIPALGLIKISVLFVAIPVLVYLFIKLKLFRNIIAIGILLLTMGLSYYVSTFTVSTFVSQEGDFYLFHFMKAYSLTNWKGLFYYIHYFWAIVYIIIRFKQLNIFSVKSVQHAFVSNKIIDVEMLVIVALTGLLPASLINIGGGSAYYFTDIQTRLAISLLLAFVLIDDSSHLFPIPNPTILSTFFKKYTLLLPLLLFLMLSNVFSMFENAVNVNLANRITFAKLYAGNKGYLENASANILHFISGKKEKIYDKLKALKYLPMQGLQDDPRYLFYKNIALLDTLPPEKKRDKAVYISPKSQWFWKESFSNPFTIPFVIPALTGINAIGMLPFTYKDTPGYGFESYKVSLKNNSYESISEDNICEYIVNQHMPIQEVLFIRPETNSIISLPCNK